MRRALLPLLLPLVLSVVLLPATLRAQGGAAASAGPVLKPGDRFDISVWRNSELSGSFQVADNGTVLHPLYSGVQVIDVPIATARERIRTFLQHYEADPRFVFIPGFRVYVGGQVRSQSQYYFPEISVAQAITLAGGATTPNRKLRVRLLRDGEVQVVNLDNSQETAALLQQTVRSGDQILLEDRPSFARNYVGPTLQVLQTVTALVSTYVFFDAIFGK